MQPIITSSRGWWPYKDKVFLLSMSLFTEFNSGALQLSCFDNRGRSIDHARRLPGYYQRIRDTANLTDASSYFKYLKSKRLSYLKLSSVHSAYYKWRNINMRWAQRRSLPKRKKFLLSLERLPVLISYNTYEKLRFYQHLKYKLKSFKVELPTATNYQKYQSFNFYFDSENPLVMPSRICSIDAFVDQVDMSLGNRAPKQLISEFGNYLFSPLFVCSLNEYFFNHIPRLEEIRALFAELETQRSIDTLKRPHLGTMIASHDQLDNNLAGVRGKILSEFDQAFPNWESEHGEPAVLCPGKFAHNTDILQTQYGDNKVAFLEDSIFNICPENTFAEGYVTEKFIEAVIAGCIPVYWGGIGKLGNLFNPKAYFYYNPRKPGELSKKLQEFMTTPELQTEFFNQKLFTPYAAEYYYLEFVYPVIIQLRRTGLARDDIQVGIPTEKLPLKPDHKHQNISPKFQKLVASFPKTHALDEAYDQDCVQAQEILKQYPEVTLENTNFYEPDNQWPFLEEDKRAYANYQRILKDIENTRK